MKLLFTTLFALTIIAGVSQDEILASTNDSLFTSNSGNDPYNKLVAKADEMFQAELFLKALELYERAATLNPTDINLPEKISLTQNKLTCGNCNTYEKVIFEADKHYQKEEFNEALKLYTRSQIINPSDAYPQKMIDSINKNN